MISLERAQQLKEVGLKWNPKRGDRYYQHGKICLYCNDITAPWDDVAGDICKHLVFAPSLTQLLDEIDKHEVNWKVSKLS